MVSDKTMWSLIGEEKGELTGRQRNRLVGVVERAKPQQKLGENLWLEGMRRKERERERKESVEVSISEMKRLMNSDPREAKQIIHFSSDFD